MVHQGDEIRVGPVVEDDEAGVDRIVLLVQLNVYGMGMAAYSPFGLEYGDVVVTLQQVGCRQAGNSAADDCNTHGVRTPGQAVQAACPVPVASVLAGGRAASGRR